MASESKESAVDRMCQLQDHLSGLEAMCQGGREIQIRQEELWGLFHTISLQLSWVREAMQ